MVERDGDAAWERIVRDYDQFSLYDFLQHRAGPTVPSSTSG
jgi:hypothetical protein